MSTFLKLQIAKELLLPSAACYVAKTVLPIDQSGDVTVLSLVRDIYK